MNTDIWSIWLWELGNTEFQDKSPLLRMHLLLMVHTHFVSLRFYWFPGSSLLRLAAMLSSNYSPVMIFSSAGGTLPPHLIYLFILILTHSDSPLRYTAHFHQGLTGDSNNRILLCSCMHHYKKNPWSRTLNLKLQTSPEQSESQYESVRQQMKAFQKVQSFYNCTHFVYFLSPCYPLQIFPSVLAPVD